MDVSDIVDELDDHGFADSTDTAKLNVINEAYWEACAAEPWPFLVKFVRLTFNGSADTATNFPSDFHAALSMKVDPETTTCGWQQVVYIRFDDFERKYGSNVQLTGDPRMFYFIGDTMHFYPVPDSTDTRVRMGYVMTPDELAIDSVEADIVLPKQFHRQILVNGALKRLYAKEDDVTNAQLFGQFADTAIEKMRDWAWRKQYTAPDYIHPVDPDDLGLDTYWSVD